MGVGLFITVKIEDMKGKMGTTIAFSVEGFGLRAYLG